MTSPDSWAALGSIDGAPSHQDEMAAGYRPQPTIAEQNRTHGVPAPAEDRGVAEGPQKYNGGI